MQSTNENIEYMTLSSCIKCFFLNSDYFLLLFWYTFEGMVATLTGLVVSLYVILSVLLYCWPKLLKLSVVHCISSGKSHDYQSFPTPGGQNTIIYPHDTKLLNVNTCDSNDPLCASVSPCNSGPLYSLLA